MTSYNKIKKKKIPTHQTKQKPFMLLRENMTLCRVSLILRAVQRYN